MLHLTLSYFGLHALMFGGAIYFRSHVLIKTILAVVLIAFGLVLVQLISVRILFWNYFTTLLPIDSAVPVRLLPMPSPVIVLAAFLFYLWLLFIAYQCLREHEVQREL